MRSGPTTPKAISIQQRDLEIFRTLFECRIATSRQLAILHFEGRVAAAKKRLQLLTGAGLLKLRRRSAFEAANYGLSSKAEKILDDLSGGTSPGHVPNSAQRRRLDVSDFTLRHELEVMNVRCAFHQAFSAHPSLQLQSFSTWPALHAFEAGAAAIGGRRITVFPDGYLEVCARVPSLTQSNAALFLEVDRSTETLKTLVKRASLYLDYFRSGGFALKKGFGREEVSKHPFRVLIVLNSRERQDNLAKRLLEAKPPILTLTCLTTKEKVLANPLGRIWVRPVDYRTARSRRKKLDIGACGIDPTRDQAEAPASSHCLFQESDSESGRGSV